MENKPANMGHLIAVNNLLQEVIIRHSECIANAKDISFAKNYGEALAALAKSSEEIRILGEKYLVLFNVLRQHGDDNGTS
jgi:hypothetical protein